MHSGLVATAYRRKRMLEGIMTADKEVRAQLAQMSEKQANDAMVAQAALGECRTSTINNLKQRKL